MLFTSALFSFLPSCLWQAHNCDRFSLPIPDLLRSSSLLERCRMEMEEFCSQSLVPCRSLRVSWMLPASLVKQQMTHGLSVFVKPLSLCMLKGRKLALMFNKTNSSKAFLCNLTCWLWRDRCVRNLASQKFPPGCPWLGKNLVLFGFLF